MIRILLLFWVIFPMCFFSQKKETKVKIDSINAEYWIHFLSKDSLNNIEIPAIKLKFKDTIYTNEMPKSSLIIENIPATPFLIKKTGKDKKWYYFGVNNLVINQASFSNWNSGGNNNIGAIAKINYNFSYKSGKHYIENLVQLSYGWIASAENANRKTEDAINYSFNYGYDLGKNIYLSSGFQFISQFAPAYNFNINPDPNFSDRISRFLAPGYLNSGLGFSYNPSENLQVIARPVNGKFTIVTDPILQKKGRYGLERNGQNLRAEIGAMLNVIYRWKIYKDITLDNQLTFFSNYLNNFQRVDVLYNANLNIKFNKYITSLVSLDLVYDHDQVSKLQHKQTFGIGFSYNLGTPSEEKTKNKKIIKPFVIQ